MTTLNMIYIYIYFTKFAIQEIFLLASRAIGLNASRDWICLAKSGEYPSEINQFSKLYVTIEGRISHNLSFWRNGRRLAGFFYS